MAGRRIKICKQKGCSSASTTHGYCRVHYLKNWQVIKEQQKKKAIKTLNRYIDHIMQKNPNGYMDTLREDLRNTDQFAKKAESMMSDDDFHDIMDEVSNDDLDRIIGSIKIDDSF